MELRHLRYFVAVAEELHFSRAALRLHMSQPPLSQQIASLESELGVKLLDRDKRNVALTKAGEVFLNRARAVLSGADDAIDEVKRVGRGYEGKLTIGFMSAVMLVGLGDYLTEFRRAAPSVEIELRQMRSNEQYAAVMNGDIDVGLVDIAIGSMVPSSGTSELNIDRALHEQLMLVVAKDHPLAQCKVVAMRDLAGVAFLTLTRQSFPTFFDTFLQMCQGAGFNPHIVQQAESMPVLIALATAGYGAALVPALGMRGVRSEGSVFIPIVDEAFVDIYLISRVANHAPLIDRLRDIVRQAAP